MGSLLQTKAFMYTIFIPHKYSLKYKEENFVSIMVAFKMDYFTRKLI